MGRKHLKIKTLHGYKIEQLQNKVNETNSEYTRSFLLAVIMSYNGLHTNDIMKALGKSRPAITRYINSWNESPKNIIDQRGGNIPSDLTDEIVDNIKDIVTTKKPSDFNYQQSTWTCALIAQYVEDNYGKKFSREWIRKLLKKLGFSYKRGLFKPTKADPEMQKQFKKNGNFFGYI